MGFWMVNICLTRSSTQIPSTMASQHPDNASPAFWHRCPPDVHACEHISTSEEVEECYRCFSDLGCEEYLWDWEGKFVDEAVIDRLFSRYFDYFKRQHLGRDKFLTFRIPNIWKEETARIARAFMAILTADDEANRLGLAHPPIFEVVLPQTDDASKLIYMQDKFQQVARNYCQIFERECTMENFAISPLIESSRGLIESKHILVDYLEKFNKKFNCSIDYLRPFIARSDPALNSGFIAASVAAKTAISEYYRFQDETGVKVYPVIGVGALHFRGGLNPRSIDAFLRNYPGLRTVTVQSAFKYDYPVEEVTAAIARLNQELPRCGPVIHDQGEMQAIQRIDRIFGDFYRESLESIATTVIQLSSRVPAHRERITFTGERGYGREVEGIQARFPRAIAFTAALYSVGVPPEFIGTGRGIRALRRNDDIEALEHLCPTLRDDLVATANFLNKGNLASLAGQNKGFQEIETDIALLEDYIGGELGPRDDTGRQHKEETAAVLHMVQSKRNPKESLLAAARLRKALG